MIVFCSILLWGNVSDQPFRIEWFVYSQTAGYFITALVALLIVIKKAKFRRLTWNRPFFMMIIRRSFPFALLVLLMTLYNRLDPVMLGSLLDPETGKQQAGIYASGYRLLDAANMIGFLFSVLLIPIFSRMLKNKESVGQMLKLSFTLLITVAIIVAAGSFIYSSQLMGMLYDDHIEQSAEVFRLLMIGFVAVSTSYIFGTLLTANGNLKELNLISLAGLTVNLLMNFWLIPEYLAKGSAWASLVTQTAAAIAQVILVYRIFRFRLNIRSMIALAVFILGVVGLFFLAHNITIPLSGIRESLSWLPGFVTATLLSLMLAFALRLLSFRGFMAILRSKTVSS
jgi:O-antigen/teichoic acid export membrane protein